jgi:polysaccharide biosynthesis protein PslG
LIWVSSKEQQAEFQRLKAAGFKWIREDFLWSHIEPQKGQFNWTLPDTLMANAKAAGLKVLPIIGYGASWAWTHADYARYAAAIVKRYPELEAIELWNEPWGNWAWPNPDPAVFVQLVKTAVPEVRAADPAVTILVSGDYWIVGGPRNGQQWLAQIASQLNSVVDAYSVHPYPDPKNRGPLADRPEQGYRWDYRRVELTRQQTTKPIWITEVGWATHTHSQSVTEAQQAQYHREAIQRARSWPYVRTYFAYSWDKEPRTGGDGFGLRRPDNSTRPAFDAVRQQASQ